MYSGDVPIAPARVDDPMWWPFRRNAVVQTATATPDGVKPYKIYVHDRTICQFISGGIMSTGQWEPDLTRTLLGKLGPASNGRVFLDIGANLGWFSLAAAAAGHRVIAIDALHTNVELLMRSIHDNSAFAPLIEVYNYAVSSSGGTVAVMRPAPLGAPEVNKVLLASRVSRF